MPLDAPARVPTVAAFATAAAQRAQLASLLEPPPDLDVADAAEKYRGLSNPGGGYTGPWRHDMAPYAVQPMRALTDPRYPKVVCCWAAQSGKTDLGLNFALWSMTVDPADMQIVVPEKQQAEDFSIRRIRRMIDNSSALDSQFVESRTMLFTFRQSLLNLSWPTSSNAASKPVPRTIIEERDSMDDDVGSADNPEGDPVELFHKRSQSFGARRKTYINSSVKRQPTKGAPKPTGAHEMPTAPGITSDYNAGTRRWLYYQCREQACRGWFVLKFRDLLFPDSARADDATIDIAFACPHCGSLHRCADRRSLRQHWLAEGESIDADGVVSGQPRNTDTDSYWMFGPQAGMATLEELVRHYLKARATFDATGSDAALRAFWNVDANEHYVPESDGQSALSPDDLRASATDLAPGVVPEWAAFVVASVDIQIDRFEIQWTAVGPDSETALIDSQRLIALDGAGFPIVTGRSRDSAASGSLESVDPARQFHHWLALVPAVFERILPLASDATHGLRPVMVALDTGGAAGVSDKAAKFYRYLRMNRPDLYARSMFVKGRGGRNPVRIARAQWDPRTRARSAKVKNPMPLWWLYVDELKDRVDASLRSLVAGKGTRGRDTLHLSRHLPAYVFDQLCAEVREGETWVNERRIANEAWDLAVYALAAQIRLGVDRIDWTNPPRWARPSEMALPLVTDFVAPAPAPAEPPVAVRPQPAEPPAGAALAARLAPLGAPRRGRGMLHRGI